RGRRRGRRADGDVVRRVPPLEGAGLGRPQRAGAARVRLAGVVLAAGAGTRLRPLTTLRPKALCPVGTVPLLDLALARLAPLTGGLPADLAVNAHEHAFAPAVAAHVAGR